MKNSIKIILASGSPRRRELLDRIGTDYIAVTSDKEENMYERIPSKLVEGLSKMKAEDVEQKLATDLQDSDYCIIGADTVVALEDSILGKPATQEKAFEMLRSLSGRNHEVYTGVCLIIKKNDERTVINYHVATSVSITNMSDDEINAYIATGEPMDKAGAYAIQGIFAPYVQSISGDYYNIVGFPISSIYQRLKEEGINL